MNYTVGIGYRFTPNFYTDLACVFRTHKEDVYAFSNMFAGDDPKPFLEANRHDENKHDSCSFDIGIQVLIYIYFRSVKSPVRTLKVRAGDILFII